ncbi:Hypothetical_protein [Hexamita inflata]|uniref:Hypothetical_protein n=1 Tax=Hexamita inflata TaxID=28002 RepID=A0AA86RJ01_9EUKA|nr:Hypothetical protein HINF_LOCUS55435 [Hexamita inflata]
MKGLQLPELQFQLSEVPILHLELPVEIEEKVLHCFRDQEIPKIVQIDQLKMNTEVLCRSSACATSYKLQLRPYTNHWILLFFSPIRLNYHIFSRQNLSQISFVDQNVEITQGHLKQVIQLVQIGQYFMNSSVGPRNEENTNASELPKFVK